MFVGVDDLSPDAFFDCSKFVCGFVFTLSRLVVTGDCTSYTRGLSLDTLAGALLV
jgi:hypothetical protein